MPLTACQRLGLSALATSACFTAEPGPLIANGGFEEGTGKDPAHWKLPPGVGWERDEERFLRLQAVAGQEVRAVRPVPLGEAKALRVALRVRHSGLRAGDAARCALEFRDGAGKRLGPALPEPIYGGSSDGWRRQSLTMPVPAGAAVLVITPTLAADAGGTLDLDDLVVTSMDPADLPPLQTDVDGNPLASADGGGTPPGALRLDGTRLVDAAGAAVRLRGVALAEPTVVAVAWAVQVWKADTIALTVDGARWGDEAYRRQITSAVQAAATRGARVLAALAGGGEPAAWGTLATTFVANSAVLFDLGGGDALAARRAAVRAAGHRQPLLADGALADDAGVVRVLRLRSGDPAWPDLAAAAAAQPLLVMLDACPATGAAPYTAVPAALARLQAAEVSWVATGFDPGTGAALIANRTAFTPTAPWGAFVRAALKGTRFAGSQP